ncbi:hypothetical protein EDB81DRAFT_670829 [Dactylonectria macrodidyma]|uniref:Nephrocystin 3-like N-terminal domain-containing protein n=1 Tax=Dactylonectria macrodidyma TaxID=307937 RepID=A0A9P9D2N6_9HYPO|nr:hypothetical protein EDB81DRAFT_670829 [Dactylonectria macrodidyma]
MCSKGTTVYIQARSLVEHSTFFHTLPPTWSPHTCDLQHSSKVVGYINGVSGSTKERKRLRESVRACEQVLQRIMDEVDDCEEGEGWSEMIKVIDAPEAPLARLSAALSIVQSKLQPRRGVKKVTSAVAWPFNDDEVDKLLAAIEREKSLLGLALNMDCLRLVQEIRKTARDNQKQLDELIDAVKRSSDENEAQLREVTGGLQRVEESQKDLGDKIHGLHNRHDHQEIAVKRRAILDWLTPVDYAIRHSNLINRQQEGTGTWLLNSDEYKGWIETGSTLFCPGIPGAGKTILTSMVVQDLVTHYGGDENTGIAYVYLDYLRQHEQKVEDLLANILKQLSGCRSSLPSELNDLHKQHAGKRGVTRPSLQDILKVLPCVAALYSRVFIIIDALDECDDSDGSRTQFLRELKNLQQKCNAKLFATSRHIPDIIEEFDGSATLDIQRSSTWGKPVAVGFRTPSLIWPKHVPPTSHLTISGADLAAQCASTTSGIHITHFTATLPCIGVIMFCQIRRRVT